MKDLEMFCSSILLLLVTIKLFSSTSFALYPFLHSHFTISQPWKGRNSWLLKGRNSMSECTDVLCSGWGVSQAWRLQTTKYKTVLSCCNKYTVADVFHNHKWYLKTTVHSEIKKKHQQICLETALGFPVEISWKEFGEFPLWQKFISKDLYNFFLYTQSYF